MGAPVAYVGLRALGLRAAFAAPLLGAAIAIGFLRLSARLPAALDDALSRPRVRAIAFAIGGLLAALQMTRLSAFMLDPSARQHSMFPPSDELVRHYCPTAYARAELL